MKLWHVEYTIGKDNELFQGESDFIVYADNLLEALAKASDVLKERAKAMPDDMTLAIEGIQRMRGIEIIK